MMYVHFLLRAKVRDGRSSWRRRLIEDRFRATNVASLTDFEV